MRRNFLFLLCAVICGAVAEGAPGSLLLSSSPRASATAGGGSFQPVLSADGQFVAFVSHANNLVTNDSLLPYLNVFLRDRSSGELSLISVTTNGFSSGDENSLDPAISADGRYVAFQSSAGNLATNDTNSASDVFLRDRMTGATLLVSRGLNGWTDLKRASTTPLLSASGRWLVFESDATNLVANDTNAATDLFLFDGQTGANSLVSVNDAGNGSRAGASVSATMTPDGRFVAFVNLSSNGSPTLSPLGHVYVRDFQAGTTTWASADVPGVLTNYLGSFSPVLSADGGVLYFHSFNASGTNLYRFDLASRRTTLVNSSVQGLSAPSPSADGRFVAYERTNIVMVWDAHTSNSVVVSVTPVGDPAPSSESPARPMLSADGTKVTFLSNARALTSAPTNGFAQLYQRDLFAATTRLLSADTNGEMSGDLSAIVPAVTPDGAIVAFESSSPTMVSEDRNLASDVFVRDVIAGTTGLLSGRDTSLPSFSPAATATLYPNSVSADGRYVAYGTLDGDLFPGDTNRVQDIFVRDLLNNQVAPVSTNPAGAFTNSLNSQNCVLSADGHHVAWVVLAPGFALYSSIFWRNLQSGETRVVRAAGPSSPNLNRAPAISADGRWVAFETTESIQNLDSSLVDLNGSSADIVLQDVLAGTNVVISRNRAGTATGNGYSSSPQLSSDGRWLAFASSATDLALNSVNWPNLFVRDLLNNKTIAVSQGGANLPAKYAGKAVFSRDSHFLAYNAPDNRVGLYELTTGILSSVCSQCGNPSLGEDGRLIAVDSFSAVPGGTRVLLIDRSSGTSSVIGTNITSNGLLPGPSTYHAVLGADGRYLVFLAAPSPATFLDKLPHQSLYVRDLVRGLTMPLPISNKGGLGNGASYVPELAADGRTLIFASFANDLASGDFNNRRDIFAFTIGSSDIDKDGLDDDWEVAYFGNLARDGSGDFDQDGQTDRAEFITGTDPTDVGSVLSAFLFTPLPAGPLSVMWNSVPGRTYAVQYKDAVTSNWSTLFDHVEATSSLSSVQDNLLPGPSRRFYRVLFVP